MQCPIPGPPFSHNVSGALSGETRASKNLHIESQQHHSGNKFCNTPEEEVFVVSNIEIARVLLDVWVTDCRFCDPQLMIRKQRVGDKFVWVRNVS